MNYELWRKMKIIYHSKEALRQHITEGKGDILRE